MERPLAAFHNASVNTSAPLMLSGSLCVNSVVAFANFIASLRSSIFKAIGDILAITSLLSRLNGWKYSLLYLGICSSGIAYTLQIVGQKEADPTVSSVILSLESVFGVIGAAMILGEQMEIREYIGCAIVFVAVLLAQTDPKIFLKKRSDENE